jgi:hypothetical protein
LFLCAKENLRGGRFHSLVRDLFAPQVIRYVDLMESSIGQSLHRAFEKERWAAVSPSGPIASSSSGSVATISALTTAATTSLTTGTSAATAQQPNASNTVINANTIVGTTSAGTTSFGSSGTTGSLSSSSAAAANIGSTATSSTASAATAATTTTSVVSTATATTAIASTTQATAAAYHCACTEQLYWKLGALQQFVERLRWPDPAMARHLQQRLRLMACDMLQAALNRTMGAFVACKRRHTPGGVSARFAAPTEFVLPVEMCAQINAVHETRNQSLRLCLFDGVDEASLFSFVAFLVKFTLEFRFVVSFRPICDLQTAISIETLRSSFSCCF